jgi:hypothetical protein
MERNKLVKTYVKRYGDPQIGQKIRWAAVVISEFWALVDASRYPGLERKTFKIEAREANFDTKRAAEAWASQRAVEIRGL